MVKYTLTFAATVVLAVLALVLPAKTNSPATPASTTGSFRVDEHHSNAQLTADGTTDSGKTKMIFTVGFARISGEVTLDNDDPAKSNFDLHIYPATSMAPSMTEAGKSMNHMLSGLAANTLVCFHSKSFLKTPDGRLQVTGTLVLTRVDRNVELSPNEAYSGPVYGPPMIHRLEHEATFVFDSPSAAEKGREVKTSGTTSVAREDFPQLVKAVIATYWPTVVQNENCTVPAATEAYGGAECTGTFLRTPPLPEPPHAVNAEDLPGPANFNTIAGNQMTILVHLQLKPNGKQGD